MLSLPGMATASIKLSGPKTQDNRYIVTLASFPRQRQAAQNIYLDISMR
jgi:hypothetical protein